MSLCPFAKHKLIAPGASDPRIDARVAILHVDAGGARSLFDFFKNRSGGIESHFHVPWVGKIEQYRDTDWEADANWHANPFAVSIETQGFAGGKWTKRQLRKIKRLLRWLNEEEGIPLEKIVVWDGEGVGYHIQFGSPGPWTPVAKSCPGPKRIKQYHEVLVPWMKRVTEPPVLRVVSANMRHDTPLYEQRVDRLHRLKPDIAFLSECFNLKDDLREEFKEARLVGRERTRSTQDVKLLIRKKQGVEVKDAGFFQITKNLDAPKRIAADRWVAWAKVEWEGRKLLPISVHFNAVVQGKDGKPLRGLRRVLEYRKGIKAVEDFCKKHPNYEPIICGDVNWRQRGDYMSWFFSPDRLFKRRLNLRVIAHGLDRIAHPKSLVCDDDFTIKAPGADHSWIIADLRKK